MYTYEYFKMNDELLIHLKIHFIFFCYLFKLASAIEYHLDKKTNFAIRKVSILSFIIYRIGIFFFKLKIKIGITAVHRISIELYF